MHITLQTRLVLPVGGSIMYHNMATINVEEVEVPNQKNKTNPGSVQLGRVSDI